MGSELTPEAIAARRGSTATRRPPPTIECATASTTGLDAAGARAALAGADTGTRQRLAASLQRNCGNAALQRLLGPGPEAALPPIQRWAVGLNQGEANCITVANYVNKNTPYQNAGGAPGWARTKADFSWSGSPVYSTSGGATTATVSGASVTKAVNVDMPVWAPTDTVMKKAWATAMSELRAHETKHENVATDWETKLQTNLAGLTVTVTAQTDAAFRTAVKKSWDGWVAQHQAEQKGLDPFSVTVDCAAADTESASGDGATGETADAGDATGAATGENAAAGASPAAGGAASAEAIASNDESAGDATPASTSPSTDERDDETAEAA